MHSRFTYLISSFLSILIEKSYRGHRGGSLRPILRYNTMLFLGYITGRWTGAWIRGSIRATITSPRRYITVQRCRYEILVRSRRQFQRTEVNWPWPPSCRSPPWWSQWPMCISGAPVRRWVRVRCAPVDGVGEGLDICTRASSSSSTQTAVCGTQGLQCLAPPPRYSTRLPERSSDSLLFYGIIRVWCRSRTVYYQVAVFRRLRRNTWLRNSIVCRHWQTPAFLRLELRFHPIPSSVAHVMFEVLFSAEGWR